MCKKKVSVDCCFKEFKFAYVVRVPVPDVGSVPACAVTKYWEELKYPFDVKYCGKEWSETTKSRSI